MPVWLVGAGMTTSYQELLTIARKHERYLKAEYECWQEGIPLDEDGNPVDQDDIQHKASIDKDIEEVRSVIERAECYEG